MLQERKVRSNLSSLHYTLYIILCTLLCISPFSSKGDEAPPSCKAGHESRSYVLCTLLSEEAPYRPFVLPTYFLPAKAGRESRSYFV